MNNILKSALAITSLMTASAALAGTVTTTNNLTDELTLGTISDGGAITISGLGEANSATVTSPITYMMLADKNAVTRAITVAATGLNGGLNVALSVGTLTALANSTGTGGTGQTVAFSSSDMAGKNLITGIAEGAQYQSTVTYEFWALSAFNGGAVTFTWTVTDETAAP